MLKNTVAFFLKHKSFNHLLILSLLLFALFSYQKVAKEMFPPTALDTVIISGSYRSASADILDKLIVQDCEEIMKENPNLSEISSVISKGSYSISATLTSGSKNLVITDITSAISRLNTDLPEDMQNPTVSSAERFFPLISLSIFPKEANASQIVNISKKLESDIGKLKYIYRSELIGKFDKSLHIIIDNKKIEAYGLSKVNVLQALEGLYLMYPIGVIKGKKEKYFVSTKSHQISAEEIGNSYISVDDKSIYIKEIATVESKYEKHSLLTRTDGKKSLMIMTKKSKRGDAIKLSKQIRELVDSYKTTYPHLDFKLLNDSSFWIKTRLNVISANILIGLLLLFFAIWVFISLKVALVVIIGIPVSFAFAIIGLDITDASLNTLSMIGVLLALGMLVDEAIVVSENIHRHTQMGESTYDACVDGTTEVLPMLFIAMLTTVIAFLPLTTLSGGMGAFIKIIPLMVIILVFSSFLESFVFLPAHYEGLSKTREIPSSTFRERFWETINQYYAKVLGFCLRFKYLIVITFVLFSFLLSFILIKKSNFILFPEFDAMTVNITGKLKGNALLVSSKESKSLEDDLLKVLNAKDVNSIHSTIGMKSDGRSQHEIGNQFFSISINLRPKISEDYFNRVINPLFHLFGKNVGELRTRSKTAKEIVEDIEPILQKHRAKENIIEIITKIPQTGVVKDDIALRISSANDALLKDSIEHIKKTMQGLDGISNIKDNMNYNDINIIIDLNTYGKSLGFTQATIVATLGRHLTLEEISKVSDSSHELVMLKLKVLDKNRLENLENLHINIPNTSQLEKLKNIAHIILSRQISTIQKEDLQKVFTITASLDKSKLTSRGFYAKLDPVLKTIRKSDVKVDIKGEAGKNKEIQKDIMKSLLFTLLGILLILTWFFNSFWLSLFSLSVIPLSILGVLLGHTLLGLPLTFSTLMGFVGLVGVVMNDTLLMLGFINKATNNDELIEFASRRIRPILLTSITTILGLSTLIFFASGESLLMQPLAVSIGFGLLWATVVNLFYVPLGYALRAKPLMS